MGLRAWSPGPGSGLPDLPSLPAPPGYSTGGQGQKWVRLAGRVPIPPGLPSLAQSSVLCSVFSPALWNIEETVSPQPFAALRCTDWSVCRYRGHMPSPQAAELTEAKAGGSSWYVKEGEF